MAAAFLRSIVPKHFASAHQVGSLLRLGRVGRHQTVIVGKFPDGAADCLIDDSNARTDGDPVEEFYNVTGTHANAAVTRLFSQFVFLRGPMDVNATVKGIPCRVVQSAQPDNAADDRIPPGRVYGQHFAGIVSPWKTAAKWPRPADLCRDCQTPDRGVQ